MASIFGQLGKAVGIRSPLTVVVTSAAMATMFVFYTFIVASFFNFAIFSFQNRVTYYATFESYIVDKNIDQLVLACSFSLWLFFSLKGAAKLVSVGVLAIIAYGLLVEVELVSDIAGLLTFPTAISLLIYNAFRHGGVLKNSSYLALDYFAIVCAVLGVIGLVIITSQIVSAEALPVRNYGHELFLVYSLTSAPLMLLLASSLPLKMFFTLVKRSLKKAEGLDVEKRPLGNKTTITILSVAMLLSSTLVIIPHLPEVNEDNQQIGVDTVFYVGWIEALDGASGIEEMVHDAFVVFSGGDRPISILFIYFFSKLLGLDAFVAVEYVPVLFGPALVLVVFFLTRELTSDNFTSVLASLLTAISFQILIGVYAGFLSNWFALIFAYLAFVVLVRQLKKPSFAKLSLFATLLLVILFSHVYTWSMVAIVMGMFLGVMFKLNPDKRKAISLLLIVIFATVAIDLAKVTLFNQPSGLEREAHLAENQAGLEQFPDRWYNLRYGIHAFLGGLFSNFIMLGLGLYWLYQSRIKDLSTIFIVIYLSAGLLPLLFGDWVIQTRVLYNIPFQIPAAIALSYLVTKKKRISIFVSVFVWLVWIAVFSLANFPLVLPAS